jgi:hypothetical protein
VSGLADQHEARVIVLAVESAETGCQLNSGIMSTSERTMVVEGTRVHLSPVCGNVQAGYPGSRYQRVSTGLIHVERGPAVSAGC